MGGNASVGEDFQEQTFFFCHKLNFDLPEKIPSEMEVALRYALLKLFSLLTLFNTVFTVYISSLNSTYKYYSSPTPKKNCSGQKWQMIQRRNTINT